MGRKPKHTFVPDEFGTLTKEERRYRGELATTLRMKIKRKEKIKKLEESIKDIQTELSKIEIRMEGLINKMETSGFTFPIFSLIFQTTGSKHPLEKGRYRISYTINKKSVKFDLDTYLNVKQRMDGMYPNFDSFKGEKKDDLILEVYQKEIHLKYWENEYEKYLEGKKPKS